MLFWNDMLDTSLMFYILLGIELGQFKFCLSSLLAQKLGFKDIYIHIHIREHLRTQSKHGVYCGPFSSSINWMQILSVFCLCWLKGARKGLISEEWPTVEWPTTCNLKVNTSGSPITVYSLMGTLQTCILGAQRVPLFIPCQALWHDVGNDWGHGSWPDNCVFCLMYTQSYFLPLRNMHWNASHAYCMLWSCSCGVLF